VIETDSADAYSIPGGHLLLTRGLLDTCGSEAALVGVLAHELSHLDREHQLIPLKQSQLAGKPLNSDDSLMWISLASRPFRPEQESEADMDATQWMMSAGYDPKQLVKLLESWQDRQSQTMPWMQFIPSFVKSHPNPGRRAQVILEQARKLAPQFPDSTYIGVANLQKRIPKSKQKFR
jgi:predicted Zn-dependent protease